MLTQPSPGSRAGEGAVPGKGRERLRFGFPYPAPLPGLISRSSQPCFHGQGGSAGRTSRLPSGVQARPHTPPLIPGLPSTPWYPRGTVPPLQSLLRVHGWFLGAAPQVPPCPCPAGAGSHLSPHPHPWVNPSPVPPHRCSPRGGSYLPPLEPGAAGSAVHMGSAWGGGGY